VIPIKPRALPWVFSFCLCGARGNFGRRQFIAGDGGAKVCYFSSHESGLKHPHKLSAYRAMPISRATENGIFLVMANAPWDAANEIGSHGNSKVIHPDGNVLQEADHHAEMLVVQSIRIEEATRSIARRCESDPTLLRDWFERGVGLVVKDEG
jgi:hypothetical protein